MTDLYGPAKYILDSGAIPIHADDCGTLYRAEQQGDEPLLMVKVINSTPEPDGHSKEYWLRVQPELRPMLKDNQFGEPQELTARNAIASTFGKRGEEYRPRIET
jgi:hypothetical protein